MIALDDSVVKGMRVMKVFRENADKINSIDFTKNGERLISTSDDDHMSLYDCVKGSVVQTIALKKYGCSLARFVNINNHSVVHASSRIDDTIRYLDFEGNKYLRYFPGHTQKVVCLSFSPAESIFLSGSLDKSLRFWDLRLPTCKGLMTLTGEPLAAFDPAGLIFAVGMDSELVKLYDVRDISKGPFVNFKLNVDQQLQWTHIKISPDGKVIMICTTKSVIFLLDAFTGKLKHTLMGHANSGLSIEASFSNDSQYVVSGGSDGRIHAWKVATGQKLYTMNADHPGAVCHVQFNPKYLLMCTTCTNLSLWLPTNIEDKLTDD